MQVWNLLHAARWKCRTHKSRQKSPSEHHRTTLSSYIFATKAYIDNRKKNLLSSNMSSKCPHNIVNFGPLVAEIGLPVCGTPSKFQRVSLLLFVTAVMSLSGGQPIFAGSLAVSWPGTLYIHFLGLLPPDGILPRVKFTLRPSLVFAYIASVTARHSRSGSRTNFAAWYKEWKYGTFAEGATYTVNHKKVTFYFWL